MNNNFTVTQCRFHTKEKDKLLLVGDFEKDLIGKNKLLIQLDKNAVSYELKEMKRMSGGVVYKKGKALTKEYFLWVKLPADWRNGQKLEIVNVEGNKKRITFAVKVQRLKKIEKHFHKYIDDVIVYNDSFVVQGWFVNNGQAKVQFFDDLENELSLDIKRKARKDVNWVYPENAEEDIIGFEAVYKGKVPEKVRIHFEENDKQKDYVVKLTTTKWEEIQQCVKKRIIQIKTYYQQFGTKATIVRIFNIIFKKETVSYRKWYKSHCLTETMLEEQKRHKFLYQPKISVVVPLYRTPIGYLNEFVDSVKNQTYSNWELCLSDGSGDDSPLTEVLKKYEDEDKRIRVVYNRKQLQISENTNAALEIATGDYIAFADHDDLIAPNALYECVREMNADSLIDIIYTDEDKIDMMGKEHFAPNFKPDFNIDMLRSSNYICHLFVVKRKIYEQVGKLNPEFDGAQDYDFILRCVEQSSHIKHIAKILYHWRAHKDSTAENPESKEYAFQAGARAILAHYDRVGIQASIEKTEIPGTYRSKYVLQSEPLISIIIPNKDHIDDLRKCITSIEEKSSYRNYEFIVVENNSTEQETFDYYKELEQRCPRAKVVYWKGKGFNYPAINNYGVECANGEYLLFLNNDTEIVNETCLEELLGYCMREDVGAVGARLYYEDGTIQHAGVVVGLGGVAGHAFVGFPHDQWGYMGRIQMAQDYSAVTAACVMVKKSVFEEVEGFDEAYAVAFNDVDLCMKIRKAGYLIVYNPYAELNHYESKSRGYEDTKEKIQRFNSEVELFKSRWGDFLEQGDPYYNPNLTLGRHDFSLKA